MESLEDRGYRNLTRPERLTGLDTDFGEKTGESVADTLTGDQHENCDSAVHLVVTIDGRLVSIKDFSF
jgi:hypothetical protein